MRVVVAIGDEDMEATCPLEADRYISFKTAEEYADAIYTMAKAFYNGAGP